MRLGCGGCLATLMLLACLAGAVAAGAWAVSLALQDPAVTVETPTAADSSRAQRKLFGLGDRGRRGETVVLSEREVNALLSRQLAGELPFTSSAVRLLGNDRLELAGQLPLQQALADSGTSALLDPLPRSWARHPVWLHVHAHARVDAGGRRPQLRLDVEQFALGRLPLPRIAARLLLDPESFRLLRLPLPEGVDSVAIEPGRAVIRIAS
jgi:hypothetical protein